MFQKLFIASLLLAIAGGLASSAFAEGPRASMKPLVSTEADNTAKNVRDRNDKRALTADDQSLTDESQTEVLGAVRRAVVAIPNLSVNGQNIKILVDNKTVTLRGPVASSAESATIERAVKNAAPSIAVDNRLEIAN